MQTLFRSTMIVLVLFLFGCGGGQSVQPPAAQLPAEGLRVAQSKADVALYDTAIVPYLPIRPADQNDPRMVAAITGLRDDMASKIHYDKLVLFTHPANDAWCVKLTFTVASSLSDAQRQEAIKVAPEFIVVLVIQDAHGWTGMAAQKSGNDASSRCNV